MRVAIFKENLPLSETRQASRLADQRHQQAQLLKRVHWSIKLQIPIHIKDENWCSRSRMKFFTRIDTHATCFASVLF